jgi:hypothetical protein
VGTETETAAAASAELDKAAAALPALQRKPIIESVPEEMLQLIAARANAGSKVPVTNGELSTFLELAAAYQLDPFAGEVWLAKSSNDRVLIMVGRDGLRRIAQRNGLTVDCDVIHEADDFRIARQPDGTRAITHSYGHPKDRGPIIGAWAEVRTDARLGRPSRAAGFYVATIEEFKPRNENQLRYSPWGAQESVMILAAAERQALRQATPLSGLVAQGELDRGEEVAERLPSSEEQQEAMNTLVSTGSVDGRPFPGGVGSAILGVYDRAVKLGHANLSDAATWDLRLRGQSGEEALRAVEEADAELDAFEAEQGEPPEVTLEVEGGEQGERAWQELGEKVAVPDPDDDERVGRAKMLRDEANELLDRAQELREKVPSDDQRGDLDLTSMADGLEAEAEEKREEAERFDPEQPTLDGGLG